jgi:hypothetical protein
MKRRTKPILLALLVIVPLTFSGCDFVMGLFDPLIGTWTGTVSEISPSALMGTATFEVHSDKTCTLTVVADKGGGTATGTYSVDVAAESITFIFSSATYGDGLKTDTPLEMNYALTESNTVLTIQSAAVDVNQIWVLEKQ